MSLIVLDDMPLARMAAAQSLDFSFEGAAPLTLATRAMDAAIRALRACEDDLLAGWGVDPGEAARVATPAEALTPPRGWLNSNDYPVRALRRGQGGTIELLLRVEPDGSVGSCRNMRETGSPAINEIGCVRVRQRARYRPARDVAGRAIASHRVIRITFLMPR